MNVKYTKLNGEVKSFNEPNLSDKSVFDYYVERGNLIEQAIDSMLETYKSLFNEYQIAILKSAKEKIKTINGNIEEIKGKVKKRQVPSYGYEKTLLELSNQDEIMVAEYIGKFKTIEEHLLPLRDIVWRSEILLSCVDGIPTGKTYDYCKDRRKSCSTSFHSEPDKSNLYRKNDPLLCYVNGINGCRIITCCIGDMTAEQTDYIPEDWHQEVFETNSTDMYTMRPTCRISTPELILNEKRYNEVAVDGNPFCTIYLNEQGRAKAKELAENYKRSSGNEIEALSVDEVFERVVRYNQIVRRQKDMESLLEFFKQMEITES